MGCQVTKYEVQQTTPPNEAAASNSPPAEGRPRVQSRKVQPKRVEVKVATPAPAAQESVRPSTDKVSPSDMYEDLYLSASSSTISTAVTPTVSSQDVLVRTESNDFSFKIGKVHYTSSLRCTLQPVHETGLFVGVA